MLCVAQHLESFCLLQTCRCLNLCCFGWLNTLSRSASCGLVSTISTFLALCLNTSTRSARCSVVSGGYLNTLTFVGLVLVRFYPLCRSNFFLLMLHSFEILSILTFFSLLLIRFLPSCFLCFCFSVFTSTQPSYAVTKISVYGYIDIYMYIQLKKFEIERSMYVFCN